MTTALTGADTYETGDGLDQLFVEGVAQSIRMTIRSDEVGNGVTTRADGGLAVRLQREDAAGALTGPVTRADDEGLVVVLSAGPRASTIELRDTDGSLIGDLFEVVILGSAGVDDLASRRPERPHYFNGGDGNDVFRGGFADDMLVGGAGDDTLVGGNGADRYRGGAGADLIIGGAVVDSVDAGADNDRVFGGGGNDLLNGEAGADRLFGGTGVDLMSGELGEDLLNGEAGDDVLLGGEGADTLAGEDGADLLLGGAGGDVLIGGAGADRFVFATLGDSGSAGTDLIVDFSAAAGDVIDLTALDADSGAAGDQAFTLVGAFSGVAGQAVLSFDAASGRSIFLADVNGDRVPDFGLVLLGDAGSGLGFLL